MKNTRLISITRKELTINSKGEPVYINKIYPCKVNAAVPFDHRMIKYERPL